MNKSLQRFLTFAAFVLVVAVLRSAREVLIPIALASLLAFLLSPLVIRLRRWRLPKVAAVAASVALAFSILGLVAWVVGLQLIDLAQQLPSYERNIQAKIDALQEAEEPGPLSRVVDMINNLRADMQAGEKAAREAEAVRTGAPPEPEPVPVEVKPARPSPLAVAQQMVSPLLGPLGTAGIAIVLLVAMLLQREDLRDRFIKVVSAGRINVATQAVDDAARRVSRYLFLQLVVNGTYGLPIGIGLYLIGIPNALLWGLLATVLRFIPFLGPWIAAVFPITLAVAVAPGWEPLLYTLLLFVVMELVSNNIIEVWLYGSGTGISNLALLIAAVFWTWVWGPIGLFLSTPLTVCLLVMGKYVPGLRFLSMLLGSEPVLEPPAQFYQRMLAMDYDAMLERANDTISRRSVADFYDSVFIPALILAEEDRHRGALAEVRQRFIFESGRELVEELDRRVIPAAHDPEQGGNGYANGSAPRVFIMAARDDADELVALMLQHLLRERNVFADVAGVTSALAETSARIREGNFQVVIISALPPSAVTAARRVCRLLRRHCPDVHLLVGIWSEEADVTEIRSRLQSIQPEGVATRVGDAIGLLQHLRPGAEAEAEAAPEALAAPNFPPLELDSLDPEAWFDAVARDLAQVFDVPVSLVTVVDADRGFWKSHKGLPADLTNADSDQRLDIPAVDEDLLLLGDISEEKRWTPPAYLVERGVKFFACAPLRRQNGQSAGRLCVIDTKPRPIVGFEGTLLRLRAQEFMAAVERQDATPATRIEGPRRGER